VSESVKARSSVELRQLRYFVILAQELNFRKAAEQLFITQPALSHQIALLEATLGVRLFERDRRRVALTSEGKVLLDDARRLVADGKAIFTKARRMGAANASTLRVGFPEYVNRTDITEMVCSAFQTRHPEAKLTVTEGYSRTLLPALRDRRLDVAFTIIPPAEDFGDLEAEVVIDERPGLLLPANHHLSKRADVPVSALAGEQLLLADRGVNPALYDLVAGWLSQAYAQPRFLEVGGSGVYTFDTVLRVVQSGEAVGLAAANLARNLPSGVVFRPISGSAPHFQVAAVWSPTSASPLLTDFLDIVRDVRGANRPLSMIS
jgi:DNA-binding transcriptional LysR family regulator